MREIKLRVRVLRPLASGGRGALSLVGGVCWGVTAGKASHNASNARGVTAGKMGRNSSIYNSVVTCRHITISTSACETRNAKKIAVRKVSDVTVRMFGPEL